MAQMNTGTAVIWTTTNTNTFLADCNQESGLNIFALYDDPDGFDSRPAHYSSFSKELV